MTSKTTVLAVVISLAVIAIITVAGAVILAASGDSPLPDSIVTIGAAASGALAGVLASTRSTAGANEVDPTAAPYGGAAPK